MTQAFRLHRKKCLDTEDFKHINTNTHNICVNTRFCRSRTTNNKSKSQIRHEQTDLQTDSYNNSSGPQPTLYTLFSMTLPSPFFIVWPDIKYATWTSQEHIPSPRKADLYSQYQVKIPMYPHYFMWCVSMMLLGQLHFGHAHYIIS